jgi:hypothetical protein
MAMSAAADIKYHLARGEITLKDALEAFDSLSGTFDPKDN